MTTDVLNCLYDFGYKGQGQGNFILCSIKCAMASAIPGSQIISVVITTPLESIVSIMNIIHHNRI